MRSGGRRWVRWPLRARRQVRKRLRPLRLVVLVLLVLCMLPVVFASLAVSDAAERINDAGGLAIAVGMVEGMNARMPSVGGCSAVAASDLAERMAGVENISDDDLDRVVASMTAAVGAYCSAAASFGVDWAILAGVGFMECFHGMGQDPGCPPGTSNYCGARGPMQFLGNIWRDGTDAVPTGECPGVEHFTANPTGPPIPEGEQARGYATDGDADGAADPWSWPDAAHAAARKLLDLGVRDDAARAAFAYFAGGAPFDPEHFYPVGVVAAADRYREAVADLMPAGGVVGACPIEPRGGTEPLTAPHNTQATLAMANAVISCLGREHVTSCYSERPGDLYEHPRGRACDFMLTGGNAAPPGQRERGELMAEWVAAHAEQLGVLYVIWWDRYWNPSYGNVAWEQWTDYSECATPCTDPYSGHLNHIHVSVKLLPGDPAWASCPHLQCTN